MPPLIQHSWNLTPKQAIELQKKLAPRVIRQDDFKKIKIIAGADLAFLKDKNTAVAAVLLFEFPSLNEIDRVYMTGPVTFPYVPGLLSFREAPILLKAFKKLKHRPEMILIDGQGIAHPRRLGIASHLGLLLDCPTIGCAKSRLCGEYREPGFKRGSWSPLLDKGEEIGAVLRTCNGVKPLFISTGHRVGLKSAIQIILKCHEGYRIPKPTREADILVGQLRFTLTKQASCNNSTLP